jgi:hypothetical protein
MQEMRYAEHISCIGEVTATRLWRRVEGFAHANGSER